MPRSHACLRCGSETAGVRAAMDAALGILVAHCPGCGAALVRRPDPLVRTTLRTAALIRTLAALALRSAAIVGAVAWTAALTVMLSLTIFLDRFGDWRPGVTLLNVWATPDLRGPLAALIAAGFASGCVVRIVWGHRSAPLAIGLFIALVLGALSIDELADAFESYYRWTIGTSWRFYGGSAEEWMGRGAALLNVAPGFVLGWFVGGALGAVLDWDVRRRWRRKLKRARMRSRS